MEMTAVALGAALCCGLVLLAWYCWQRWRRQQDGRHTAAERVRRELVLRGASRLRSDSQHWQRVAGVGQIDLVFCGGYGSGTFASVGWEAERAGVESFFGHPLMIELDDAHRRAGLATAPAAFASRAVVADCQTFSVGMTGEPVGAVLQAYPSWGPDVLTATREWMAANQRDHQPGMLAAFISPGGSAALAFPVLRAYRDRYPHNPIYVLTILDEKTPVRAHLPEIRALYSTGGLTRGFCVSDNRRFPRRSDSGITSLLAASVAAPWVSDLPQDPYNLFRHIFPAEVPGRIATISVFAESLPVHRLPPAAGLPEMCYTPRTLLEEKMLRGIETLLTRPELQALPLPAAGAGNPRLCVVSAPIVPVPDLQTSARRIRDSLGPWRLATDPDLALEFASIGQPLDAQTSEVRLLAVLLQPLADDARALDALARGAAIDDRFRLPPPVPTSFATRFTSYRIADPPGGI